MSWPADDDLTRRIQARLKVRSIDYWRRLVPECTITDDPFPRDASPYPIDMRAHVEHLRKEGYFQTEPLLGPAEMVKLRGCIEKVVADGHPARYALLYDDFYHVLARLSGVLVPVLGEGYQLVPDELEAYFIAADDDARGTKPHRDSLRTASSVDPDGTPTLINVWIPLTDAEPPGSCIYVVPAHRDPGYPKGGVVPPSNAGEIVLRDGDLVDVRALPARAGSVLAWSTHLLHWGSRSSVHAKGPRMSFAIYFQSRRVPPYHGVTMDIPGPIPFDYRLYLVGKVEMDPSGEELHHHKP